MVAILAPRAHLIAFDAGGLPRYEESPDAPDDGTLAPPGNNLLGRDVLVANRLRLVWSPDGTGALESA